MGSRDSCHYVQSGTPVRQKQKSKTFLCRTLKQRKWISQNADSLGTAVGLGEKGNKVFPELIFLVVGVVVVVVGFWMNSV